MNLFSEQTERELSQDIVQLVTATIDTVQSQQTTKRRYLKQNEALDYCGGISKDTFRKWVTNGLPEIKVDGILLYDIKDLDEFILTHKI